ncbi:rho-type guanine nucleotide exchange factor isoform X2 [Lycorma delicatula]|uniref:rho-type guanine nucleotide exchange factor isoform X2 n=1 Tax=Lycorma delicatula TaxID=130591 RepID=UPI003F5184B6
MAANNSASSGNSCNVDINNVNDPERKQPFLVQAVYSFKGKNNDELCFKKGDIITVTQVEEGGWWEGTLGEKTGWFPSNYVNEYKISNSSLIGSASVDKNNPGIIDLAAQQKIYRSVVLKDLIDSERAHLTELQGLMHNFLIPLEKADIMKNSEYSQLISNLHEIIDLHDGLLNSLVEVASFPGPEQRVGRVFITIAPQLKQVLTKYCCNHPRAVCVLDKYKQELGSFMESNGAASPGLLVLTAGLSKPFRRLEKYAGMLQELERHVEENHIDRGDTQRSVSVFKDIASLCSVVRRQKEMELEVISGGVRGWEGEDLSCLGEIIHMGSVAVGPEHHDRYLVLFPSTLLMLSVSHRMSAFIYEGKLPLAGISVNKLEDTNDTFKNAFEIVGPMIEKIVAVCQTKEDQQTWVDLIRQQIRSIRVSSPLPSTPAPPPHSPIVSNNIVHMVSSSSSGILQQSSPVQQQNIAQSSLRPWNVSCLRPSPPLRTLLTRDDKTCSNNTSQQSSVPGHGLHHNSSRKLNERCFEEDAQILRVIEGYCANVKSRYTITSVLIQDSVTNFWTRIRGKKDSSHH